MNNDKEQMSKYYDLRAPEYEQIYFRDNPPRRKEIDDEADRLRLLSDRCTILDIPCGTGYWSEIMSEKAESIVAADLSEQMLVEAKKKKLCCHSDFVQCDISQHPFGEGKFDLVALGFWFSHHPRQDYDKLFDQLDLLLSDNGKIWMIENNEPAEGPKFKSTGKDKFGNNYKERFLDDDTRFVILKNYFSEKELQEIFSPRYQINRLTYGHYYWSIVLSRS